MRIGLRMGYVVIVTWMGAATAAADPGGYAPPGGRGSAPGIVLGSQGGPGTLLGLGDLPPGRGPDRFGLHPCLKKFFHIPPGGYGGYGCTDPTCATMGPIGHGHYARPYPAHGTLVFPHHPYVRSPRDFFMVEPRR